MAVKVLSVASPTSCGHLHVTVDDGGQQFVYPTVLDDIDTFGGVSIDEARRALVFAWLRYRRLGGRPVTNVEIV